MILIEGKLHAVKHKIDSMKLPMKLFVLLFLYHAATAQSNPTLFVPASNLNIQYIGRFDLSDKAKPVFMYSGTAIKT